MFASPVDLLDEQGGGSFTLRVLRMGSVHREGATTIKHARKSGQIQLFDVSRTTTVEIPLPLVGVFADIEK